MLHLHRFRYPLSPNSQMKKISTLLIATILLLFSVSVHSQVPVEKIRKLLDKAAGGNYIPMVGATAEYIDTQTITPDSYTVSFIMSGGLFFDQKEYTNIPWSKEFTYNFTVGKDSSNLTCFVFEFKKELNLNLTIGFLPTEKYTQKTIELYVLTTDAGRLEDLVNPNGSK